MIFIKTMLHLLQYDFIVQELMLLNWHACSPHLSPVENWPIMKQQQKKTKTQRRPRALEQLKSFIRQSRGTIPHQQLMQLVTDCPYSVVKE